MRILRLTMTVALTMLGLGCADKGPSTFVSGEPISFPVYSKGMPEDLLERMKAVCRSDDDPEDEDCIAYSISRKDSCLGDIPDIFETEAEYRTFAKRYIYCLDTVE